MNDLGLVAAAFLLGLGGSAHCAAMCGAPCAALVRGGRGAFAGFHVGRLVGYMAGGAVAAASVSTLAVLRDAAPVVRPLWLALHVAVLVFGLWLVVTGRQPDWRLGRAPSVLGGTVAAGAGGGWVAMQGPARPTAFGLAWIAWPCGLLYSALALAAMANGPLGGAAVMGAFALASMPALAAAPWLFGRLTGARGRAWAVRVAGLMLAGAAAFALGHGVWQRALDWCLS
jgi:sulfite exporter TauE/SafE